VCNTNISIHASNIFDFLSSSCLPAHRTNPIPVGRKTIHHTHTIIIYGGVYIYIYICTACGATAKKKLEKLSDPCDRPTAALEYNIKAYKDGRPPKGFSGWPYKQVVLDEYSAMHNFQTQLNLMRKHESKYKPQFMRTPSDNDSNNSKEESPATKHPRMHSPVPEPESESDSD